VIGAGQSTARRSCTAAFGLAAWIVVAALAQEGEAPRTLIPGKGSDLTTARCATCHDAQHITRAKLSRGEWEFTIQNMIERGAPIAPGEIPIILEYLAAYYNRDHPAPAPDPQAASFGMDNGGNPVAKLLAANACVACHSAEQRLVGPSFREIAARYAGEPDAAARLAQKVKQGGAGTWGSVPMPPNAGIPDAELGQILAWILEQR
jgi:sulfite dehydrogenase